MIVKLERGNLEVWDLEYEQRLLEMDAGFLTEDQKEGTNGCVEEETLKHFQSEAEFSVKSVPTNLFVQ